MCAPRLKPRFGCGHGVAPASSCARRRTSVAGVSKQGSCHLAHSVLKQPVSQAPGNRASSCPSSCAFCCRICICSPPPVHGLGAAQDRCPPAPSPVAQRHSHFSREWATLSAPVPESCVVTAWGQLSKRHC